MAQRSKKLLFGGIVALVALAALALGAVIHPTTAVQATGALPCTTGEGGPPVWTALAPVPLGVEGSTGVIIGNKIYVTHGFTGFDNNITQIYDIPSNSWDPPGASAAVSRSELAGVCAIEDGVPKVFAIGGRGLLAGTVEVYDPGANSWTPRADMPGGPRGGLGATYVPTLGTQGTILAIGGRTGGVPHSTGCLGTNEAYDVASGAWAAKASMPTPMGDVYSTIWSPDTGLVYVIGGWNCATNSVSNLVQRYDPAANAWLANGAPMPTARSNLVTGVCGGSIYAIGGLNPDVFSNRSEVEIYDPFADVWSPGVPVPSPRSELASTAVSTGSDIYAIGSGAFGLADDLHDRFQCEPKPEQPGPVGGVAVDPDLGELALETPESSSGNTGLLAGIAATVATGVVALVGAAWYARRRVLR